MRLIIFDCDGTLVDSQHMIVAAMTAAFAAEGLTCPSRRRILQTIGLSLPEAVGLIVADADRDRVGSLILSYKERFATLREQGGDLQPMFPGARKALRALVGRGDVLLGLATGKSRRGVDAFIAREGLAGVFATVQTADCAPSKPHPVMLHQAMAETGAGSGAAVMIGDTSFDMEMARHAGIAGIGVSWGYHDRQALWRAGAMAVARDFTHLMELLDAVETRKAG